MEKSRAAIISRIEQLQATKGAVLRYLAEASSMSAETLFSIFYEFLDDFESSRIMLEKKELAAQRERRLSTAKKLEGRSKVAGMINDKSTAATGGRHMARQSHDCLFVFITSCTCRRSTRCSRQRPGHAAIGKTVVLHFPHAPVTTKAANKLCTIEGKMRARITLVAILSIYCRPSFIIVPAAGVPSDGPSRSQGRTPWPSR